MSPTASIVFTSLREGDLDLYLMNADGSGVTRLTDQLGYDGGAFFSWDGAPSSTAPPIRRRQPSARSTWRCSAKAWYGRASSKCS